MTTIYAPGTSGIGTRERAKALVGTQFAPGWCLYFQLTKIFKVPGVADYDHDGAADAEDYWKAAVARGIVVKTNDPMAPPPGAQISWRGGSRDNGHSAYALGKGEMVSTDLPNRGIVGRVPVSMAREKWGLEMVGYVIKDGNGFTLIKPQPNSTVVLKTYTVTAAGGLRGHRYPDELSPTVYIAKQGAKVEAVRFEVGSGYTWAVTKNGVYYATKYLKAV